MYYPAAVWGVGHFCTAWFAYGSAITYVCDSDVTILRVNKTRDVPPCRPCLLYVLVCLHVSSHPTPPPKGRVCIHAVLTTSPHLGACGHDQGAVLLHDLWHLVQRALVAMELPHLSGLGGGSQTRP